MSGKDIDKEGIPERLRQMKRWVCWMRLRDGTLEPINCTESLTADITRPDHLVSFEQAMAFFEAKKNRLEGVGFAILDGDPFTVVRLDDCRNPQADRLKAWASAILKDLQTYSEVSPTGKGVQAWLFGRLPSGCTMSKQNVAVSSAGSFVSVTGMRLRNMPPTVENRQTELLRLCGQEGECLLTDDQVIEMAKSAKGGDFFCKLLAGDVDLDDTRADLALCQFLAYWASPAPNEERIGRLFGRSTLAERGKWAAEDGYRSATVRAAIHSCREKWPAELETLEKDSVSGHAATVSTKGVPNTHLTDDQLLEMAQKKDEQFEALWNGDTLGYFDVNSAIAALCGRLAFWTGRDPERVAKLCSQSTLALSDDHQPQNKDKYFLRMAALAVANQREFFTPERQRVLSRIVTEEEAQQLVARLSDERLKPVVLKALRITNTEGMPTEKAWFELTRLLHTLSEEWSDDYEDAIMVYCEATGHDLEETSTYVELAWKKVKLPYSEDVLEWAMRMAEKRPVGVMYRTLPEYQLMVGMSYHLSKLVYPKQFLLPVQKLARLFNTNDMRVSRIIGKMEERGVVSTDGWYDHIKHIAKQYHYIGRDCVEPESEGGTSSRHQAELN